MNVSTRNTANLEAILTIEIKSEDYQVEVDKVLKDYRKKADIPGFRKGNVPMGLIKKQYGMPVLVDEVNKLLQKGLYDHLDENKIEIVGSPIPVENNDIDWDKQKEFSFDFELGLKPKVEVELNQKVKIPYYKIEADEAFIDRQVKEMRKRFGKISQETEISDQSLILVDYTEVTKSGGEVENAITGQGAISAEDIKNKKLLKSISGQAVGFEFKVDVNKDFVPEFSASQAFQIDKARLDRGKGYFNLTVNEINATELAELNQELFDKVFGEGGVASETEFRDKIKTSAKGSLENEGEQKFLYDLQESLISKAKLELPEAFLKKWIKRENSNITEEELEEQFEDFKKGFQWQLIEEKIITDNDLQVSREDLEGYVRNIMLQRADDSAMSQDDEVINSVVSSLLQNQEQVRQISQTIMENKIKTKAKELIKVDEKELTFDQFVNKVTK